jgi:molecular chaperone GrpE
MSEAENQLENQPEAIANDPAVAEVSEPIPNNQEIGESSSQDDRPTMSEAESHPEEIAGDPAVAEVSEPTPTNQETAAPTVEEPRSSVPEAEPDTSAVSQLASLSTQLQQQTEQYEAMKLQYVRLAADFENFRKRTQKEKEEMEVQIKCNTIGELLTVVDNFERAREQLKPQTDGETTIHKSYQSVYKQMVEALKRLGVSKMRPEGKEFDPNLHEAVLREPSSEYPEGTVIQELVGGYLLGDRVLRHAMVKVAAAMEPIPAGSNSETESQPS